MTINVTFDPIDLLIFLLIAFVAGSAAASLMYRGRKNVIMTTLLGIVGAFIGQYIFRALDLTLRGEFFNKAISIADIAIAFFGAVIILFIAGLIRR